jgi:predicted ribonuclease YlaK
LEREPSLATKKNMKPVCGDVPHTLASHPFYGLVLDEKQEAFRDAIWDKEKLVIMCNASAGTGKTLVAAATANLLVQYGRYNGIVYIVSPYAESRQGFLRGSIEEKSEPYFEPFCNALIKIGVNPMTSINDSALANQKSGTGYIECRTDTFLRGINLENVVVIMDESQNFTFDAMRTAITRCSDNSKLICIGHDKQCDLPSPSTSGFTKYVKRFADAGDSRVAICELTKNYRGWISSYTDFDCC